MSFVFWCLIIMGGLGAVFGLCLALASRFFPVEAERRIVGDADQSAVHPVLRTAIALHTALALYGTGDPPMIATNVGAPDPVYQGERSLRLEDNSPRGTPQAFVAWVVGMAPG